MIQPIKLGMSGEGQERLCRFLGKKVRSLKYALAELHETRLPMWRRAYEAVPAETIREFPWVGLDRSRMRKAGRMESHT